jgi:hypothetical protein
MNELRALPSAVKLTVLGLMANAIGIWIQAFSGAPEYPTIPPGPIILVIVAAAIALGATRWRWLPLVGGLLSLQITIGAFVTPYTANRLNNPSAVGAFIGTLIQIAGLAIADVSGLLATVQQYGTVMAKAVCKIAGLLFVIIGVIVLVRGGAVDTYHNLLHLGTGVVALVFGFAGSAAGSRRFCGVFGTFYVALGVLGVIAGNAAANRMLDVGPMHLTMGDHLFHIVLGSIFVVSAVPRPRALPAHEMTNVS